MASFDGFHEAPVHNLDWHNVDDEFHGSALRQLADAETLVFGRETYEMMAGYWASGAAKTRDPDVAAMMNEMDKVVFSATLKDAS
jgi:dihydrofolate reductase